MSEDYPLCAVLVCQFYAVSFLPTCIARMMLLPASVLVVVGCSSVAERCSVEAVICGASLPFAHEDLITPLNDYS